MVEPMEDPNPTTAELDGPAATRIALWTPRGIGWASVFLGFPGAVVLAAMNWRRMGRTRKAILHLSVAVIGTLALLVVSRPVALLAGLAVGYYLYTVQRSDQAYLSAAGRVTARSGLAGAVIALVASIFIVAPITLVVAATSAAYEHRGEVLFHADQIDDCSPPEPVTELGPADPVFFSAVMRETVQPGSHVVVQIDGPGIPDRPVPVTVEPPFDCLGGSKSLGPLDPGTYVFRFRYDGPPGAPDLAVGTLTITPNP